MLTLAVVPAIAGDATGCGPSERTAPGAPAFSCSGCLGCVSGVGCLAAVCSESLGSLCPTWSIVAVVGSTRVAGLDFIRRQRRDGGEPLQCVSVPLWPAGTAGTAGTGAKPQPIGSEAGLAIPAAERQWYPAAAEPAEAEGGALAALRHAENDRGTDARGQVDSSSKKRRAGDGSSAELLGGFVVRWAVRRESTVASAIIFVSKTFRLNGAATLPV